MPEELWSGAVVLAKAFGVCPIACVGDEKYDVSVAVLLGLLRDGAGLPMNRLERGPPL